MVQVFEFNNFLGLCIVEILMQSEKFRQTIFKVFEFCKFFLESAENLRSSARYLSKFVISVFERNTVRRLFENFPNVL